MGNRAKLRSSPAGNPNKTCNPGRLAKLERSELQALWREWFGAPPPARISQSLLRLGVAWQMQARSCGIAWRPGKVGTASATAVRPGTRFIREWHGTAHEVEAVPEGFLWQGECHRSLSAIARAITGMRWSGPKFFGLKEGAT